jgi:NitT/TauT family transport system substrate-binding protein
MFRFAALALVVLLTTSATAQEHVSVATQRSPENGALFIADARGYFKAEGLDVEMTAYSSERDVAQAAASGAADFGLAGFSPAAFDYAGEGLVKFVAAQVTEKRGYQGAEIAASNLAWMNGLHGLQDLDGKSVGFAGPAAQYQLTQIAKAKNFEIGRMTLKPMQTQDDVARALASEQVQAAILPAPYANELVLASQVKLVGWYSEVGTQQVGALFASAKMLNTRRAVAEKFVRAYRRGAADYAGMVQLDRSGKRLFTIGTREIATIIARYAYPGRPLGRAAALVEATALPMDPRARLEVEELARQVEWYRAQKLITTLTAIKDMLDTELNSGG